MFLGGFIAWISEEQKRIKVAALAIASPAIITTWSGGQKAERLSFNTFHVNWAYAQSTKPVKESHPPVNPDKISSKGTWAKIKKGVGAFFGYNKLPEKYWVIVGSYKDRDEAQRFADKINKEDETLNAWVGVKLPENNYFPVIVGDQTYLSEAKEI